MTQNAAIARYLESGKPITPMLALSRFGCMRLAARIRNLRDQGYDIDSRMVKLGKVRFASYRLAA